MFARVFSCVGIAACLLIASPALASDDNLELWLNPSVEAELSSRTSIELETAQRFRGAPEDDTYFFRLWLNRELSDTVEFGVAAERRFEGSDEETRLMQQVSFDFEPLELRTRLEQRFVSSEPRTGWRLRQRVGIALPFTAEGDEGWVFAANAEGFFTLRPGEPDGNEGFTRIRTFIGVEREFGPIELSLGYLREQNVRENAPDRVGHAPFLGISYEFD